MPGRGSDRGISCGEERTGISDHLFKPSIQDELAAHVDRTAVHHGDGAVCGDRGGGEII